MGSEVQILKTRRCTLRRYPDGGVWCTEGEGTLSQGEEEGCTQNTRLEDEMGSKQKTRLEEEMGWKVDDDVWNTKWRFVELRRPIVGLRRGMKIGEGTVAVRYLNS